MIKITNCYALVLIAFCFLSCLADPNQPHTYSLSKKHIQLNRAGVIEYFTISVYAMGKLNEKDIRASTNKKEITRYCCKKKPNQPGLNQISFVDSSRSYEWYFCKLDLSIVSNDSLGRLTLDEKLKLSKTVNTQEGHPFDVFPRSFPFEVKKDYIYQIFGLTHIEGSYYFCLDSSSNLIVQYYDRGAF